MSVGPFVNDKTKDKTLCFVTLSTSFRLAHFNCWALCVRACVYVCVSGLGGLRVSVSLTASDTLSSVLQISSQSQKENTRHGKWDPAAMSKALAPQPALSYAVEQIWPEAHEACLFTFKHPWSGGQCERREGSGQLLLQKKTVGKINQRDDNLKHNESHHNNKLVTYSYIRLHHVFQICQLH